MEKHIITDFKKQVKVGDKIRKTVWATDCYVEVTYIGRKRGMGLRNTDGKETPFTFDNIKGWRFYTGKKKKCYHHNITSTPQGPYKCYDCGKQLIDIYKEEV